jgi:flagellar protein FliO/FliZ
MDLVDFARYVASLLVVLGLLGGVAWLARHPGARRFLPALPGAAPGRDRRMAVRESLLLDPKRRVVIIAVDGVEHVMLLGASGETILESRAAAPEPARLPERAA